MPVEIIDVDEWRAEYMFIAENTERRGEAESDPIKKAHIAEFMRSWWDVKNGNNQHNRVGQNVQPKTMLDVADYIGESEKTTQRLLKLNELIPQLQRLVSTGKLGTTSAEQLAFLTPEVQTALYDALGEEIGERTVAETKQLRQEANGKSVDDIQRMLDAEKEAKAKLQQEKAQALADNAKLRDDLLRVQIPKVVEKEIVVEKVPEEMQRKYDAMLAESRQMEQSLARNYVKRLNTTQYQIINILTKYQ